jgi:hypothetical protein
MYKNLILNSTLVKKITNRIAALEILPFNAQVAGFQQIVIVPSHKVVNFIVKRLEVRVSPHCAVREA